MINTHTIYKELIAIGVSEQHAEIFVENFATKAEFKELEEVVVKPSEFTIAINNLRHELHHDISKIRLEISKTKTDILYWFIPFFLTNIGLIIAMFSKIQ